MIPIQITLYSIREGLCAGVPLIVMPLFAEQAHNAQLVLAMGIGPVINKYTLTADSVFRTIHGVNERQSPESSIRIPRPNPAIHLQVVADPQSQSRAQRHRAIFLDRPMPALDEGAFWVDRLMRLRPGRRANFVRKGTELNWLQFTFAEWAALLVLVVALLSARK
jgi:hypothetical protein